MKVKDLIKELKKIDENENIKIVYTYMSHCCGDGPCYCSDETKVIDVRHIDLCKDLRVYDKDEKGRAIILS